MSLQRKCACGGSAGLSGACGECDHKKLLQRHSAGQAPASVPPLVHEVLDSPGQPLDASTRAFMESRFGHDFARVRIHSDARAAESAVAVSALAYTVGNDVVFGAGRYAPSSAAGRRLLAHELAHTIQQSQSAGVFMGSLAIGPAEDAFERAADATADWVMSSGDRAVAPPPALPRATPALLRRQPDKDPKPVIPTVPKLSIEIAGANRVKWRASFAKSAEAETVRKHVTNLGVKADPVEPDGKQWTFYYYPLTEDEAKAEAKARSAVEKKYAFTVEHDKIARTFYLQVTPKCPEAIPPKSGYTVWLECFDKKGAQKQVGKFKEAKIDAEVIQVTDKQYGVYYKPMTEAEAKTAGEAAAKRDIDPKFKSKVTTSERKELKSFTYTTTPVCPDGFTELGDFDITSYVLAKEEEFPEEPKVKDPCGLTGTFRKAFLFQTDKFPRGVKMEGSGKSIGGKYIHFERKDGEDCFKVVNCALTATSGVCATKDHTAAVDFSVIKKGSNILIEGIGERVAEDTGGKFKGGVKKIDIFQGEDMSLAEANKRSYGSRKVCKKD